jgi:hypothetical protein
MTDLSFEHLQLELARLNVLLRRQVARMARRDAAAQVDAAAEAVPNPFYLSPQQAMALLQRPSGAAWPLPDDEMEAAYRQEAAAIEAEIAALVTQAEARGEMLRLQWLALALGLDRFELDVFLLALAPGVDGRFGQAYGFLQDDLTRKRPSPEMVLNVLLPPSPERLQWLAYFRPDAALRSQEIVTLSPENGDADAPLIRQALLPDEALAAWLLTGLYQPPQPLAERLRYRDAPSPDEQLLPEAQRQAVAQQAADGAALLAFTGKDELSRETAVETAAAAGERPLLTLTLAEGASPDAMLQEVRRLLRDAMLTGALPCIARWDVCLTDDAPPRRLLETVCAYPAPVVISGETWWQPHRVKRERRIRWFRFPLPDTAQRARLLTHFLHDEGLETQPLAGQFRLTSGQIRDLVDTARDMAAQDGRTLQVDDLFAAARAHSSGRLAALARKITPRYSWNDLILADDQIDLLREMVNTVRCRSLVLEEWGVGRKLAASAGVTALFFGPPGTGKTMGAEVIARELGLDLYKIDLSTMVSKYIGETEKNLEKIFAEAESSNAILFFDEADAIFGKRSEVKDAHDRYANIEISYLLQRMESFDGVTILATNLKANLDEAFTRRLQFAVDFPFPRAADRLRIWQTLFPPDVPRAPDLDLERMAESFEITGGNIRNILINAAYLAATDGQVVGMAHLLHGARRELQKMGRLVNEQAFAVEI